MSIKVRRMRHVPFYRPVGVFHAAKGGGLVLRDQSSWRTINGVFLNTRRTGLFSFEFRRVAPW